MDFLIKTIRNVRFRHFYRSTTAKHRFTMSSTCFVFDRDEQTKISLQLTVEIPSLSARRQFNLLRSADDSLSQTIRRLIANIEQVTKKKTKKRDETSDFHVELVDAENQPIDSNLPNKDAWKLGKFLLINNEKYRVEYNPPGKRNKRIIH